MTSPARTLQDLAACNHPRTALALNEALVRRLVHPDHLTHARLRRLLDGGLTPTRSTAERRLLALVAAARLPRPETNVRIEGYERDALWREPRLAVEIDGFAVHRTRTAFEGDRRRDAQLFASTGITTLRFTWSQLTGEPEAVVARLAAALVRGAR